MVSKPVTQDEVNALNEVLQTLVVLGVDIVSYERGRGATLRWGGMDQALWGKADAEEVS